MKKILFVIVVVATIFTSCKPKEGKLSGVVTYYFNSNIGDKPDVGSNVYILNTKDFDTTILNDVKKYEEVKATRDMSLSLQRLLKTDEQMINTKGLEDMKKSEQEFIKKQKDELELTNK